MTPMADMTCGLAVAFLWCIHNVTRYTWHSHSQ